MELILIRHAATVGSAERRYTGQTDNRPLSEHGKRELTDRKAQGKYPSADALYVSPMSRCIETARILYPMLVPVYLNSLAELDFGSFEGKTYDQLKDDPAYRRWVETSGMAAPPGGESGQEFSQRLHGAIRHIADDSITRGIRRAAVVTHGSCITNIMAQFTQSSPAGMGMYQFQTDNGGGYRLEMDVKTLAFSHIFAL